MRKCKVFVGNSHPELGKLVCERLGIEPAPCRLKKFANGETSVQIDVSVRDEDVYIIQSSSPDINDHIMELLILISACKGGSAAKITAVIPMFPYSKQSKMKKHRGAITARMLANLLIMAGADHVVSMDLHASQMQGFFSKPVDNLYGAPTLAKWLKLNLPDYKNAVVVSKNPGGTKRVTALADSLKINFAMIHTDRRRAKDVVVVDNKGSSKTENSDGEEEDENIIITNELQTARIVRGHVVEDDDITFAPSATTSTTSLITHGTDSASTSISGNGIHPSIAGRKLSTNLNGISSTDMSTLHNSSSSNFHESNSDDDDEPDVLAQEKLITLVGDVQNKPAIILDDMVDKPTSFISAAEHLRLNCGANAVYIVATHGVFSSDCLESLENCKFIDKIVVTNTYPISKEQRAKAKKLVVIDVSPIFAECIRRDHFGESISVLFNSLAAIE
ncbi:hypothetical protein PACTADRAFT_51294 [Pachysolen tannophilus NRRL Y-2460]|uniref:Ribose-phosphate pyrophosphokinase 1 n=1 Tax=Pachysolen tannophilus NRRL Y-2460 TaxID=669874 RepID=A0A1E4TS15_PACTA|nr:hypothetical protein PACTADRAFT_51294 [Pachysolen tannophilus NRRL Y-2460]